MLTVFGITIHELLIFCLSFGRDMIFHRRWGFFLSILSASEGLFIVLIHQTNHFYRLNIQGAKQLRTVNHLFWYRVIFQIVTGLTLYVIIIAGVLFIFIFCRAEWCTIWGWWLFRKVIWLYILIYGVVFSWWYHLSMEFLYLFRIFMWLFGHWFTSCMWSIGWHHFRVGISLIFAWTA